MCWFFVVIKLLILKILLAGLTGLTTALRYDYGYHPSAEEFDNLLHETQRTWTHDLLKSERDLELMQKQQNQPKAEARYFVPKFNYNSNNNNNEKFNINYNNEQKRKFTNFLQNPYTNFYNNRHDQQQSNTNNKDELAIQNIGSSLDFTYFPEEIPKPFYSNNNNNQNDENNELQPHFIRQSSSTTTRTPPTDMKPLSSSTLPEINLKPIAKPDILVDSHKYSINNLYKNNTQAHFPIYFTNPATGIVYTITEVGKSDANMTRKNGTIPIFITKEQYERDIMLLKNEYENNCFQDKKTKKPLTSFSRPITTTTSTTSRPQIIRLKRPTTPTSSILSITSSKFSTPLKKPTPVLVKTELIVKDKRPHSVNNNRPLRKKKKNTNRKKKIRKSKPPGRKPITTTAKPILNRPQDPKIILGSRTTTRKPFINDDKLSTQLEKPNYDTNIFSSRPYPTEVGGAANINPNLYINNRRINKRSLDNEQQLKWVKLKKFKVADNSNDITEKTWLKNTKKTWLKNPSHPETINLLNNTKKNIVKILNNLTNKNPIKLVKLSNLNTKNNSTDITKKTWLKNPTNLKTEKLLKNTKINYSDYLTPHNLLENNKKNLTNFLETVLKNDLTTKNLVKNTKKDMVKTSKTTNILKNSAENKLNKFLNIITEDLQKHSKDSDLFMKNSAKNLLKTELNLLKNINKNLAKLDTNLSVKKLLKNQNANSLKEYLNIITINPLNSLNNTDSINEINGNFKNLTNKNLSKPDLSSGNLLKTESSKEKRFKTDSAKENWLKKSSSSEYLFKNNAPSKTLLKDSSPDKTLLKFIAHLIKENHLKQELSKDNFFKTNSASEILLKNSSSNKNLLKTSSTSKNLLKHFTDLIKENRLETKSSKSKISVNNINLLKNSNNSMNKNKTINLMRNSKSNHKENLFKDLNNLTKNMLKSNVENLTRNSNSLLNKTIDSDSFKRISDNSMKNNRSDNNEKENLLKSLTNLNTKNLSKSLTNSKAETLLKNFTIANLVKKFSIESFLNNFTTENLLNNAKNSSNKLLKKLRMETIKRQNKIDKLQNVKNNRFLVNSTDSITKNRLKTNRIKKRSVNNFKTPKFVKKSQSSTSENSIKKFNSSTTENRSKNLTDLPDYVSINRSLKSTVKNSHILKTNSTRSNKNLNKNLKTRINSKSNPTEIKQKSNNTLLRSQGKIKSLVKSKKFPNSRNRTRTLRKRNRKRLNKNNIKLQLKPLNNATNSNHGNFTTPRTIKPNYKKLAYKIAHNKEKKSTKDDEEYDFFDYVGDDDEDESEEDDEYEDDEDEEEEEDYDDIDNNDKEPPSENYSIEDINPSTQILTGEAGLSIEDLKEKITHENSSSAEEDADFGALEEEPIEYKNPALDYEESNISVKTKNSNSKKRIRRRPPQLKSKNDYADDDEDDDDEENSISSNLGGFFRMIFYPIQALMGGVMDTFGNKDAGEDAAVNPYTQYTSYHNTLKQHSSDDYYEDDDYDSNESTSSSSLSSWLSSWFGLNRRNKKIGSTTVAPVRPKPTKSSSWLPSWFGYGANDRISENTSTEDEDEYDKWFTSWFGDTRPKARKRTTTTTTSTTTQLPQQVPILTIVDPMRNPQNWIGILAHHIINHTTTQNPLKDMWTKATTTTENPEIPRKISYDKYQIWRLKPQDDTQVRALEEYKKSEDGIKLQWLKGPSLRGLTDVLVPPKMLVDFQASLTFELIDHEVLIFDVGKAIAYEKSKEDYLFTTTQNPKKHHVKHPNPATMMTWQKYYEYDDIIQYLETMRMRFPQLVELLHIGRSYEGRPLIVMKIESKEAAAVNSAHYTAHQKTKLRHKKRIGLANAVFIEAGTHGMEWIGPATATWIINELLKTMKKNATNDQSFIRNTTWYIMPVLNPDGYVYSHEYDRFWKKSRSRHVSRPSGIINSAMTWLQKKRAKERVCFGVDLDRNWHYQWGKRGSSKSTCNEFYAGPVPFSEPETKALSEFLMDYRTQIKLFISMQAYGQIISYPHKANTTYDSERLDDLLDVAMVGTDGLRKKGSKARYKIDSSNDLVENRSGCSDSFAAYEVGIPFSYTLQLADNGVHGYLLPSASIESTAKDSFEIITGMLDYI